jgi:hypothetical protein
MAYHHRKLIKPARVLVLIGAVLFTVFAGSAAASGRNSVHVKVPYVRSNVQFAIKVTGHAASRLQLYLFIDYKACGRNPAVEKGRSDPIYGTSAGGREKAVKGNFNVTSRGWHSRGPALDHACAYLVNGRTGAVVAHAFKPYTVH